MINILKLLYKATISNTVVPLQSTVFISENPQTVISFVPSKTEERSTYPINNYPNIKRKSRKRGMVTFPKEKHFLILLLKNLNNCFGTVDNVKL